jgi:hypothetical protein
MGYAIVRTSSIGHGLPVVRRAHLRAASYFGPKAGFFCYVRDNRTTCVYVGRDSVRLDRRVTFLKDLII